MSDDDTKESVKNRMDQLAKQIQAHNVAYFQDSAPVISDDAYDRLVAELEGLEAQYPQFRKVHSPTSSIGDDLSTKFGVFAHQWPMLSLDKTYTEENIVRFMERVQKQCKVNVNWICELKIDGVALSIRYQQGKMVRILTRGDGSKGEDITEHAQRLLQLPTYIEQLKSKNFEVRGEAFMPYSMFKILNKVCKARGLSLWANPRNIVSGTLKSLDVQGLDERKLTFYGYSLYLANNPCVSQEEALQWLAKMGFQVASSCQVCQNIEEIMAYIAYWEKNRLALDAQIDGIVIKANGLHIQQQLGHTAKAPRWAIAYKYKPDVAQAVLQDVTFHVGRTGMVTPVAHFSPIWLAGSNVQRASLHNSSILSQNQLHIADRLWIKKGGDIIPQVVGVDLQKRKHGSAMIHFIQHCPACQTPLVKETNQAADYCPHIWDCPGQLKAKLSHFAHRGAMDIGQLGPKTIDLLFQANLVQTIDDLYTLEGRQIAQLDGFQERSTQKLLNHIAASIHKPFAKVLFALSIKHVGATMAKNLANHFGNIDRLQSAKTDELLALPDVGEKVAQSLCDYFNDPIAQAILARLKEIGLQFSHFPTESAVVINQMDNKHALYKKKIVISGIFHQIAREELVDQVEQRGGWVVGSVSAKVDFLIVGTHPGPAKLAKARALMVPIVGEAEIIQILL